MSIAPDQSPAAASSAPAPTSAPPSDAVLWLLGVTAFLGVYSPQPLLPTLARDFGVGVAEAAGLVSALAFGIAIAAPFVGAWSDTHGRRRVVLTSAWLTAILTASTAFSPNPTWLLALRFFQGVATAGMLTTAMAYSAEESPSRPGAALAGYVTGTVLGGFTGRLIAGLVEPLAGWRGALAALGLVSLLAASILTWKLPPSVHFRPLLGWSVSRMLTPLRDRRLIAAYVAGFGVLFSLVSSFTYMTFRLDAPPFGLGPTSLSMLFVVYLLGLVFTPIGGRALDTRGHLWVMCVGMGVSIVGVLLTLPDWLPTIILGLGAASCGVFVAQAAASSFVGARATAGRAGASGLYLTAYYLGGAAGAVAPAGLWHWGGWPAVATLTIAVQLLVVLSALTGWRGVRAGSG